jgi:hypothetical protein
MWPPRLSPFQRFDELYQPGSVMFSISVNSRGALLLASVNRFATQHVLLFNGGTVAVIRRSQSDNHALH